MVISNHENYQYVANSMVNVDFTQISLKRLFKKNLDIPMYLMHIPSLTIT
jgi:hypothetical protein